MMLSMFSGRRGQWVGPAFRAWSLGSQQKQRPAGRRHRLLLFTGPWEAVMSSKVSSRWPENLAVAAAGCVSSQGCENINSLCLIAVSSSEMIGMAGGACSGIPSGSGPWPSSFSGNCVGLHPPPVDHAWGDLHLLCVSPHRRCYSGCSELQDPGKCQRSGLWVLPWTFSSGSSRASVFPRVQENQELIWSQCLPLWCPWGEWGCSRCLFPNP